MHPRLLLLLVITAAHMPTTAVAQRAFIGFGAGVSRIDPNSEFVAPADTRPSSSLRAGLGGRRVKVVLDWQRHGWGDGEPLPSDYQNGVQTREPEVLRTDFLLLGAEIDVSRGFYVRPALGVAGFRAATAEVDLEPAVAAGLSAGYHLKLHRSFSLAIEASVLHGRGVEGVQRRTVFGIQVIPLLEF
jgi:hypothetical protein